MDFAHLQALFSTLQTRPDKIRSLVDYILLNTSSNQSQIATSLQKAFTNSPLDAQLAIFYTISQILLISSQKREITYFKVLSPKLIKFLQSLSSSVEDMRVMKDICRTLDKWQSQQMFAGNYMEKLKGTVKYFYTKIKDQQKEEERMIGFKKYKRTFLMQINDLKNYQASYQVYQNHCEYVQIQQKLTNLNLQFSKIDFDRSAENPQIHRRRSQELLKIYNDLRQKLQNVIVKIQKSFNKMRGWAMEQFDTVKKQYGINQII